MRWQYIKENWSVFRLHARRTWSELTDDELCRVAGDPLQLIDKVRNRYAIARAEAERQVNEWACRLP